MRAKGLEGLSKPGLAMSATPNPNSEALCICKPTAKLHPKKAQTATIQLGPGRGGAVAMAAGQPGPESRRKKSKCQDSLGCRV